jgi:hypothetical protein
MLLSFSCTTGCAGEAVYLDGWGCAVGTWRDAAGRIPDYPDASAQSYTGRDRCHHAFPADRVTRQKEASAEVRGKQGGATPFCTSHGAGPFRRLQISASPRRVLSCGAMIARGAKLVNFEIAGSTVRATLHTRRGNLAVASCAACGQTNLSGMRFCG